MSSPYVGEIRMFAGNFAPAGWAFCQGQVLPISENDVLFNLIGTTYGGDGQETFALPNLQSRVPIHQGTLSGSGQNFVIGQSAGEESVTLTTSQIPGHTHAPQANSNAASADGPGGNVWALSTTLNPYSSAAPSVAMAPNLLGASGGSQPHDNMLPFLVINFILSLFGVFPSQT
ncbi:MAG TPA: tail fiber protein [Terriglobales bacterium]|nr:tail fiber protein [Terriglobales bacterium]